MEKVYKCPNCGRHDIFHEEIYGAIKVECPTCKVDVTIDVYMAEGFDGVLLTSVMTPYEIEKFNEKVAWLKGKLNGQQMRYNLIVGNIETMVSDAKIAIDNLERPIYVKQVTTSYAFQCIDKIDMYLNLIPKLYI